MCMNQDVINWLLDGPEWIRCAVRRQLLDETPDPQAALQESAIANIVESFKDETLGFPALKSGTVSYKGPLYWNLFFLADIGFSAKDLQMESEFDEILDLQAEDGTYTLSKEMKPHYFCISSILLHSIGKMRSWDDPRLERYSQVLLNSQRLDGGWHCAARRAVGQKLEHTESCPMDNLNILLLFGQQEQYRQDPVFNGACDLLLRHWQKQEETWRPYGFGIGTDFKRLKYPAVTYGILRVLDVLSLFPYAVKHEAFRQMLDCVRGKAVEGKYSAESVVKNFAAFDFGQKKEPSRWITFLINRIEKRVLECQ
jgi:hypothetical protein